MHQVDVTTHKKERALTLPRKHRIRVKFALCPGITSEFSGTLVQVESMLEQYGYAINRQKSPTPA